MQSVTNAFNQSLTFYVHLRLGSLVHVSVDASFWDFVIKIFPKTGQMTVQTTVVDRKPMRIVYDQRSPQCKTKLIRILFAAVAYLNFSGLMSVTSYSMHQS